MCYCVLTVHYGVFIVCCRVLSMSLCVYCVLQCDCYFFNVFWCVHSVFQYAQGVVVCPLCFTMCSVCCYVFIVCYMVIAMCYGVISVCCGMLCVLWCVYSVLWCDHRLLSVLLCFHGVLLCIHSVFGCGQCCIMRSLCITT